MKYLSLDQALVTSGGALYEDNQLLEYGTFQTKSSAPIEQRLGQIGTELDNLVDKYEFDYLFLEDIQKQSNAETFKKLAYVQAAIILWCYWRENIPYTILSPSHGRKVIKQTCGVSFGKTRAEQKKAAQQFVEQQFNIKVDSDIADAICIGFAGYKEYNKNRSAF